jgi:hypothetical protein
LQYNNENNNYRKLKAYQILRTYKLADDFFNNEQNHKETSANEPKRYGIDKVRYLMINIEKLTKT